MDPLFPLLMRAPTSRGFELAYALITSCFTAGLFLDGYAHNHLSSTLETFFTPWHGVFYAGYLFSVIVLLLWTMSRKEATGTWKEAVPPGHGLSILGAEIFFFGGIGDMLWHIVFGIEANIDAILSPTHLLLATGMFLMLSGGMRHFWMTRKPSLDRGFVEALPLLLSLTCTVGILLFMTQFGHYTDILATGLAPDDGDFSLAISILGVIVFSVTTVGALSLPLRREMLPFGAVTVFMVLLALALGFMRSGIETVLAAGAAGLIIDIVLQYGMPLQSILGRRIACALLPSLYYLFSFLLLHLFDHVWWSVHAWTGSVVIAAAAGWLVGYVAWPPKSVTA